MANARLLVEIAASTAEFREDLGRAVALAEAHAKQIEQKFDGLRSSVVGKLKGIAAALGVGLSVDAFASLIKDSIETEARLGEVGKRAGLTGEQLSSLSRAARLSHTDLEDVAQMSAKLSKALIESQDSTSKSALVLRALGITSKDTARLLANPADAVFELAKKINLLPEGGTKAAAQLLILGRAGGTTSAFLEELAKQSGLVATRTTEQIESAKALEDQLSDIGAASKTVSTLFANALIPVISDIAKVFTDASAGSESLGGTIKRLAADGTLKTWAQDAALALGTFAESMLVIVRAAGAFGGSVSTIVADLELLAAASNAPKVKITGSFGFSPEEAEKANSAFDSALTRRNATLDRANKAYADLWNANGTIITDALKKQFALSDAQKAAGDNLAANADANDRKLSQINKRRADDEAKAAKSREAAVRAAVAASNRAGGGGDDPTKKILEGELRALAQASEREKAILSARNDELQGLFDSGRISMEQYFAARKSALQEDADNTRRNFEEQVALLQKRIATPGIKLEDRADAENKLNEATHRQQLAEIEQAKAGTKLWFTEEKAAEDYRHAIESISAELLNLQGNTAAATRIRLKIQNEDIKKKLSASGDDVALKELETLERRTIQQAELNDLQTQFGDIIEGVGNKQARIDIARQTGSITELEALQKSSDANKERIADLQRVADAYTAIAKATGDPRALAAADALNLKIEQLAAAGDQVAQKFREIFTSSFADAFTDVITGTKSVSQAFKDLERSIVQSISRIAAQNIAESIFGKGSSGGGIIDLFAKLFGSGLGTSGGGAPPIGDIFGVGLASGGSPPMGKISLVGEKGPELFVPNSAGTIIPNHALRRGRGGNVVSINVNVLPGASRASADQAAVAMGVQLRRSMARNT